MKKENIILTLLSSLISYGVIILYSNTTYNKHYTLGDVNTTKALAISSFYNPFAKKSNDFIHFPQVGDIKLKEGIPAPELTINGNECAQNRTYSEQDILSFCDVRGNKSVIPSGLLNKLKDPNFLCDKMRESQKFKQEYNNF